MGSPPNRDPVQHPEPSSSAGSIGNMEQEGADKAQSSRMWQLCSSTRLQRSVCEEGPRWSSELGMEQGRADSRTTL